MIDGEMVLENNLTYWQIRGDGVFFLRRRFEWTLFRRKGSQMEMKKGIREDLEELEEENFTSEERELYHKTMADFTLQNRPSSDLFAHAKDFYRASQFQAKLGHHMYRRLMLSASTNRAVVLDPLTGEEREMIMMGSNSYLGLNTHPRVKRACLEAVEKYGVGAGSPPHFSGYYDLHRRLEEGLARLKGAEAAIVYPSGYSTNIGVLSCFLGPEDSVVLDRLAHASIIDGARLSGAQIRTFRHNDMDSLERTLSRVRRRGKGDCLVVVEGVYSMDGDIAPLDTIYELVQRYGAKLMVDEAHATGVIGENGRGSPSHFGLEGKIDLVMGTFSKSLGGLGGFVAARKEVVHYLRYFSRSYFFAASPPPPQVAALYEALQVMEQEPVWRERLWENIRFFHGRLRELGFEIENTQTAVTPLVIGDTLKLRQVTKFLHQRGIFVNPVPYPAVPPQRDRLRLSLSALHTREDLETVLETLLEANRRYPFV